MLVKWFSQVIDSVPVISCIFTCSILRIQEAQCTLLSLRRKSYISNFPSGQADAAIFPGLSGSMAFIKLTFRFHSFFYLNETVSYYLIEPMLAMLTKYPDKESTGIRSCKMDTIWNFSEVDWKFFNRIYFTFADQYYCSRLKKNKTQPLLNVNLSIFKWHVSGLTIILTIVP